jgi:hypothetical protein
MITPAKAGVFLLMQIVQGNQIVLKPFANQMLFENILTLYETKIEKALCF